MRMQREYTLLANDSGEYGVLDRRLAFAASLKKDNLELLAAIQRIGWERVNHAQRVDLLCFDIDWQKFVHGINFKPSRSGIKNLEAIYMHRYWIRISNYYIKAIRV